MAKRSKSNGRSTLKRCTVKIEYAFTLVAGILPVMNPEHLHLALNHIPIIGLACALVPILFGILANHKITLISGLVLAMVCGWTTPLVMETGDEAGERYMSGSVRRYLDPDVKSAFEAHENRADKGSIVMYAAAVLATISLGLAFWRLKDRKSTRLNSSH